MSQRRPVIVPFRLRRAAAADHASNVGGLLTLGSRPSPALRSGLCAAQWKAGDCTELGVQIELIDPFTAEPGAGDPLEPLTSLAALNATLTREPVIKGTITYPPASGLPENSKTGFIYIALAPLWPEMFYPLLSYAAQKPIFPHDSTGDQWFDDDEFTAYTQLGRELGVVVQQVRDGRRTRWWS